VADDGLLLVDSSIWIDAWRSRPDPEVVALLDEWIREDRVATTPVIRVELLSGAAHEPEFRRISDHVGFFHTLDTGHAVTSLAARTGFDLRRRGYTVPTPDLMIAAAAMHAGCRLAHRDDHFDLIARHTPLKSFRV
jgi:hypothetical protein